MPRLASPSSAHAFIGLSLVLLFACGGKVEDFRTADAGPTADTRATPRTEGSSPDRDASSPAPGPVSSADAGRCGFTDTKVKLVPHPANSSRCSRTETCVLITGEGDFAALSCPNGVASRTTLWANCDATSCSCRSDNFDVDLGEGGHAFDLNEPRTCSYSVERVK